MFSTVVLPAPLGPMTETISPFVTSRLTRVTACTPPNALLTSRISTNALTASPRGGGRPPPPPPPPPTTSAATTPPPPRERGRGTRGGPARPGAAGGGAPR